MTSQPVSPTAQDYVRATEDAFTRCPNYSGLRLISAEVHHGYLRARFEGPVGDFRGPYGARVMLPTGEEDAAPQAPSADEAAMADWAHAAVIRRSLEAHALSAQQERGYTSDDVWWLIDDSVLEQEDPENTPSV